MSVRENFMIFAIEGVDRIGKTSTISILKKILEYSGRLDTSYNSINIQTCIKNHRTHSEDFFVNFLLDLQSRDKDLITILDRGYLSSLIYSIDPSMISKNGYNIHTILSMYEDNAPSKILKHLSENIVSIVFTNKNNIKEMYINSDFTEENCDYYDMRFLNYENYKRYQEVFNNIPAYIFNKYSSEYRPTVYKIPLFVDNILQRPGELALQAAKIIISYLYKS